MTQSLGGKAFQTRQSKTRRQWKIACRYYCLWLIALHNVNTTSCGNLAKDFVSLSSCKFGSHWQGIQVSVLWGVCNLWWRTFPLSDSDTFPKFFEWCGLSCSIKSAIPKNVKESFAPNQLLELLVVFIFPPLEAFGS